MDNNKSIFRIGAFAISALFVLLFSFFFAYAHTTTDYVGYNSFYDSDSLLVLDTAFFLYVVSGVNILLIILSSYLTAVRKCFEDKLNVLHGVSIAIFLSAILIIIIAIAHTAEDLDLDSFGEALPFIIFLLSSTCCLFGTINGMTDGKSFYMYLLLPWHPIERPLSLRSLKRLRL